jgi:hypothetical protein
MLTGADLMLLASQDLVTSMGAETSCKKDEFLLIGV